MQNHFDYIILGAGLSGLTVALRMARDDHFRTSSIAIIDQDLNKGNDRTWCFWETTADFYEPQVTHKWSQIVASATATPLPKKIAPYQYKKVEGEDVYAFAKAELSQHSNITFIEANVTDITTSDNEVTISTDEEPLQTRYVLNSIYKPRVLENTREPVLQQHFVGWFIKTNEAAFDPNIATYMDFSVPQKGNCRFMYVLPTSTTEALLEYTLFSKKLLAFDEYERAITTYLADRNISEYTIQRKENGCIPMTTYDFTKHNTARVLHIGTAGGWTKASTGYTFKSTLKKSKELVSFLKSEKPFAAYNVRNRWTFYDAVLLKVLEKNNEMGAAIFSRLFERNDPQLVFKFLDEETSFWEELKIMWSCPKWLFFKSAFKVFFLE